MGNSIEILHESDRNGPMIYYWHKETLLHIGAAMLDLSLLQLPSNQTAQILPKVIFDLPNCSQ